MGATVRGRLEGALSDLHIVLGIAVLATNLAAGGWGAAAWLHKRPSPVFWYLLRAAQAAVAAQAVLGLLLVARGQTAPDGLHIAYGVTPLVVTLVSEGMRVGAAQSELEGGDDVGAPERAQQIAIARRVALAEMGVMTIGALLILTLALRAYQTGG
ncbi:MAG: hypothetical protein ACR2NH_04715 [Solirubrobacteraceae bacterium]